jgi:hypothetical protein
MGAAWHGRGMAWARRGMAWARHGLRELAFIITDLSISGVWKFRHFSWHQFVSDAFQHRTIAPR